MSDSVVITWLKAELAKFGVEIAPIEAKIAPIEAEVKSDAIDIEQKIIAIGYPMLMQDALALVTGAFTGSPWAVLLGNLIKIAENQGHELAATAADAALNLAKAQLVVAGTVAPMTPIIETPTPAADAPPSV